MFATTRKPTTKATKMARTIGVVVAVVAFLMAAPASARPKKKRGGAARDSVSVVVLPFSGKGTGGSDAKEAIELELELVDVVKVAASADIEKDVERKGKRAFEPATLGAIMAGRGVDVLIRGERGGGDHEALLVTAYGKDGQPRFYKELALGSEADFTAGVVVSALKPNLASWQSQKVVKLPTDGGTTSAGSAGSGGASDDDDLLSKPAKPTAKATPVVQHSALDDDDDAGNATPVKRHGSIDDEDEDGGAKTAKKGGDAKKSTSPLDFNDPADGAGAPKASKRRSSKLDDDSKPAKIARTEIDENGRKHTIEETVDDTAAEPDTGPKKPGHVFALSGAFDGATWYYGFDGGGVGDTSVVAAFYPGGSLFADAWPLSFAGINWIGLDGELGLSAIPFQIGGGDVQVTPSQFTSLQTRAAVALKARYSLKNGIGFGLRAGYRFYGASVDIQTISVGGVTQNLTVVPGYTLHAATLGGELFVPLLILSRRFELDLRADALPLTFYVEAPDNPGAQTVALGWSASLAMRYDVVAGFFVEARGMTTGANITYTQQGSRLALVGNQLEQLQGGTVLNLMAGFSAGLGFMF